MIKYLKDGTITQIRNNSRVDSLHVSIANIPKIILSNFLLSEARETLVSV